ncbi:uncharacterized protein ANIA_11218 [Aspergillus nidulans FGSC A4]|uniref:Ubiquitin carboxyl-terminal hydrolase n=1 Tax=Emericella nidulans (strain FGSC A4 / ATCC 38163 / CBS 112.46 / NRRL 194 / M139) TaxID=227321 RepID=C8VQB4_EMENI|nr:hypothetical protein [Aspergillus nidulans FGSC A4]CBF87294.1 TPA: conserved hypothetical protein [Aspergillus nidulans FGSC A4]
MNQLATKLGLSSELQFYDVYSLNEPEQLAHIPRPAFALLVVIPLTPAWDESRKAEDADKEPYTGSGTDEPVIWYKQTIGHACGLIGLLHSLFNGPAVDLSSLTPLLVVLYCLSTKAFSFFHPSAFCIAQIAADTPVIIFRISIVAIVLYFMVGLTISASALFAYGLILFAGTMCMTAMFRAIGAAFDSFDAASRKCTHDSSGFSGLIH